MAPPDPHALVEGPHLAGTIHRWRSEEQTDLLCQCLVPRVEGLKDQGRVRRFWFDRYDARGPHLFLLITVPPGLEEAVRQELDSAIQDHLARYPAGGVLPEGQVLERHRVCIGRALCSLHAPAGVAARDATYWALQPGDAYPFFHLGAVEEPEALWCLLDELCRWVAASLDGSKAPQRIAIQWLVGLEESVARWFRDPLGYWEYYAESLMPSIEPSPQGLAQRIGSRNEELLGRAWHAAPEVPPWSGFDRLVAMVANSILPERNPFALLREVAHMTIKQLGVFAWQERPMVLYGWKQALRRAASR